MSLSSLHIPGEAQFVLGLRPRGGRTCSAWYRLLTLGEFWPRAVNNRSRCLSVAMEAETHPRGALATATPDGTVTLTSASQGRGFWNGSAGGRVGTLGLGKMSMRLFGLGILYARIRKGSIKCHSLAEITHH